MNFWQYLDNRDRRKFLKEEIEKIKDESTEIRRKLSRFNSEEKIIITTDILTPLTEKLKYYEDKLNALL